MAQKINPSKLLPQSKSTALATTQKSSIEIKEKRVNIASSIKPIDLRSSALSKDVVKDTKVKDEQDVNNKLIKIDKFFKSDFLVSQKKAEGKRKEKEKKDFDEAERKLELPKIKGFSLPKLPSLPTLGILEKIKRFIFFTALGWLFPKIVEFLPKLEGFVKLIGGVYEFAEGLFGKLFDGFMSLVKFGGDLKDKTIGFIAQITGGDGKNYQQRFDQLEKLFNTFVNASIIAGLVGLDLGLAALDEYNKWKKKNAKPKPEGPEKPKGAGGEKPPKPSAGGKPSTPKPKLSWWEKLTSPIKSKIGKLAKPFSRFASVAVPGLGAAMGYLDMKARKESGDNLGAFLAGLSAGLDTFTLAVGTAALASAATGIGIPGAAVLGSAATAAGIISMTIDAVLFIRDILKLAGVNEKLLGYYRGGKIVRKYQGGGTTSKPKSAKPVTPPRRTLKAKPKKPPKIAPPKTKPGKDVGGEKKVKDFYSKNAEGESPVNKFQKPAGGWLRNLFGGGLGIVASKEQKSLAPYNALTSTAEILKEIPLVGGIMGAAVDVALGQKPDRKVYKSLSSGIGYFVQAFTNQQVNLSISSLMGDIRGFAAGGYVPPSRELKPSYDISNIGDTIAKVLEPTIEQKVNDAVKNIANNIRVAATGRDATGRDEMLQENLRRARRDSDVGVVEPLSYDGLESGDISSMQGKAQVLYDEFRSIGYTDEAAKRLVAEIGREGGYQNKNLFGTHLDPSAKIPNTGMISWNDVRRDRLVAAAKRAGVWDSKRGQFKENAESLRFQARFLSNEVPSYSKELDKILREEGASSSKISSLLRDKYIRYRTDRGYSGGPDVEYGSVRSKEWYQRITPNLKPYDEKRRDLEPIPGMEEGAQISTKDRMTGKYGRIGVPNTDGFHSGSDIELFGSRGQISKRFGDNSKEGPYGNRGVEISFPFDLIYYDKIPPGFRFAGQSSILTDTVERRYKVKDPRPSFGQQGSYFYRDSKTNQLFQVFMGHGNKPFKKFRNGEVIKPGTVVGWQGASGTSDSMQGGVYDHVSFHVQGQPGFEKRARELHLEFERDLVTGRGAQITEKRRQMEKSKQTLAPREYDVIIPLDHHKGMLPDKSLWPNASQGASGRERAAQDPTAQIIKARLERKGLKVKIMRPEDYRTEDDYNKDLVRFSKAGSVVSSIHYDAPANIKNGGIGFLARLGNSPDKNDREYAEKLAIVLQRMAKEAGGPGQRYGGIDTQSNITMRMSGPATAALIELGALVEQEKKYGKEFWRNPEFIKHLNDIADATASSVQTRSPDQKPVRKIGEQATLKKKPVVWDGKSWVETRSPQGVKVIREGQKERKKENEAKLRAQRPWWDKFGWFGGATAEKQRRSRKPPQKMEGGGPIPISSMKRDTSQSIKGFASYETYGSSTSSHIAVLPVHIKQTVPVASQSSPVLFPVPVPVGEGLNSIDEMYRTSRGY